MADKLNNTKEVIAEKLNFPRDVILDIPKISIIGDSEIDIENHKGIILFEENEVKINTNVGNIIIEGSRFEILFIGGSTITISGKFKSITYESHE